MAIKPEGLDPFEITKEQIPADLIHKAIRSIWWKKCEQESAENGILACEAKVRVFVYIFYQHKKPKPRIFIETIRHGDLVSSHQIATFDTIKCAEGTFYGYASSIGVTPKRQANSFSVKDSFEVIF